MKQTMNKPWFWYAVAAFALLLAVPNGTIVKVTMESVGPDWFNLLRFLLIAVLLIPVVIKHIPRMTRRNMLYAVLGGITYSLAVFGYTNAIHLSQASFVTTIDLLIPVFLMIFSAILVKEKITRKAVVGISIAVVGAFGVVALPRILSGDMSTGFGLVPTLLALLNCVTFPLSVIFSRKANAAGLSLWGTFGIMAIIVSVSHVLFMASTGEITRLDTSVLLRPDVALAIAYSSLAVTLLARLLTVAAYERIGSAAVAGLSYIETMGAIILPMLVLGEVLPVEVVASGMLILAGVLIIEMKHAPHFRLHRKHFPRHT